MACNKCNLVWASEGMNTDPQCISSLWFSGAAAEQVALWLGVCGEGGSCTQGAEREYASLWDEVALEVENVP